MLPLDSQAPPGAWRVVAFHVIPSQAQLPGRAVCSQPHIDSGFLNLHTHVWLLSLNFAANLGSGGPEPCCISKLYPPYSGLKGRRAQLSRIVPTALAGRHFVARLDELFRTYNFGLAFGFCLCL